mmetsp:Transcript_51611/g.88844  ORF Transcript_51611/g.88844 Transcript_51611/m.88844 type:complete len:210 (-) Transcript_51611:305-934(-)
MEGGAREAHVHGLAAAEVHGDHVPHLARGRLRAHVDHHAPPAGRGERRGAERVLLAPGLLDRELGRAKPLRGLPADPLLGLHHPHHRRLRRHHGHAAAGDWVVHRGDDCGHEHVRVHHREHGLHHDLHGPDTGADRPEDGIRGGVPPLPQVPLRPAPAHQPALQVLLATRSGVRRERDHGGAAAHAAHRGGPLRPPRDHPQGPLSEKFE